MQLLCLVSTMALTKHKMSVSVLEMPSKRFLTINLPSEEGGDTMTMECFFSLMEAQLTNGMIWMKLLVGDRPVSKSDDAMRPVRFFLLDHCPWFVYTVDLNPIKIQVKSLTGKTVPFSLRRIDTVQFLKERIGHIEHVPPDQLRVIHGGRQLESDRTLL